MLEESFGLACGKPNVERRPRGRSLCCNSKQTSTDASVYSVVIYEIVPVGKLDIAMNIVRQGLEVARDPWHTRWICPLLLLADAGLTSLVVWKIPCTCPFEYVNCSALTIIADTEIDWTAYMEQVSQYIAGELDYTKLYGGTGPLVYPAAHVYIYEILYKITDQGRDVPFAQMLFGVLYLLTLGIAMACYRKAKVSAL